MPYEKEIKEAKAIGDGWIEEGEGYKAQFRVIKKEHLALEKGALKKIQQAVDGNEPDLKKHLGELEAIKENLKKFYDEGKRLIDEFDKWALKEPRQSMAFISEELKLGDVKSEKYKAVQAGIKSQLTDVASMLAEVQRAWRSDLEIALKNHMDRVETLEQIINGVDYPLKSSSLKTIRDKTGFHYDTNVNLKEAVDNLAVGENSIYLAQHPANGLYYIGSALVFRTIFVMIADKAGMQSRRKSRGARQQRVRDCERGRKIGQLAYARVALRAD
jgi:hypothetical protein